MTPDLENCLDDMVAAYDLCGEYGAASLDDLGVLLTVEPPGTPAWRGLQWQAQQIGLLTWMRSSSGVTLADMQALRGQLRRLEEGGQG